MRGGAAAGRLTGGRFGGHAVLNYILEEQPSAWVVRFDGDIGGQDDKDLRKLFVMLVQERKTRVVADMTKVGFLDSIFISDQYRFFIQSLLLLIKVENFSTLHGKRKIARAHTVKAFR